MHFSKQHRRFVIRCLTAKNLDFKDIILYNKIVISKKEANNVAKLKFTEKNGSVCIKCRFTGNEMLNQTEYKYFTDNKIKGWLMPFSDGRGSLEYTGAKGFPLMSVLKSRSLDKECYFSIVLSLLEHMRLAESCGFNMKNIVLAPEFMTLDTDTLELYLFYLPLWYNESSNDGIVNCLRRISTYATYVSQEDFKSVDGFMNFICRENGFTVSEAEEYIRREVPSLFPQAAQRPQQVQPKTQYFTRPASKPAPAPETRSVQPQNAAQAIIDQINKGSQQFMESSAPVLPEPKIIPSLDTQSRNVLPELYKTERQPRPEVNYPKLTRRATGVTVNIDRPVFKIGKERDRVDFCVTENRTISRLHATIYTRNGSCFVEDNNSTNRTYINGTPVLPDREIKLKNGDVLKLSDEEFDFIDA